MIGKTENKRGNHKKLWTPYNWMIEGTREPIKALFGVSDLYINTRSFHDYYYLTDTAVALDFEQGKAHKEYFSDS